MGKTKYYYNPETCQYERVRVTFWNVLLYCVGVVVVSGLMFAGIVVVFDQLVTTDQEKALQSENQALAHHKVILASQLADVESTISDLHEMDNTIYEKLFDEKAPKNNTSNKKHGNNNILAASESEFETMLQQVQETTQDLYHKSATINSAFGGRFNITAKDAEVLQSVPTLQPVINPDIDLIVSGFGTRINPFHKGKYMHTGMDFAAPRGTPVFATAPGRVITVNSSALKAGYGNYIEIDHGNGFVSRYAHLEDLLVKQGQRVDKGMTIGTVGTSGGSIAPHLHYEIIQDKEPVDPLVYMVEGLTSEQYNLLVAIGSKQNQSLD